MPASVLRRSMFVAVAASIGVGLAGCDPPAAEEALFGPKYDEPFAVASGPRETVPADGALVVRFTLPVDPRSVSARSIRVTRADGRRPLRVRATTSGQELRVSTIPGREFAVGETLVLRVDGAPSPRAVRSKAGDPLPESFATTFDVVSRRADLSGPRLLESRPRDGAQDVAPGADVVELRFSEPIARGAVTSGAAAALRVDGVATPARLALSGDGSTLVVHPSSPLPPDRDVEVELRDGLLDRAGNPLDAASPRIVRFHTLATSLHELTEDFVDPAKCDARATSCGWDDPETPGVLVARDGPVLLSPDAGDRSVDLGETTHLRFQILVPAGEAPDGLASALRVDFAAAPADARVLTAVVEAGRSTLDARGASFVGNRSQTDLRTVASVVDPVEIDVDETGARFAEITFESPLPLRSDEAVLLDVRLETTPGVRVAAHADVALRGLVEGRGGVVPDASLLVSPAAPQARSLWYDTGVAYPGWRTCSVVEDKDPGVAVVAEFQSAPAADDGAADASRASPWETDLSRLPAFRFVRFRLRFLGTPETGAAARVDKIVLPYER